MRWTVTALDIVSSQGLAVVTSGFALCLEGASQKTVRDLMLRLESAREWNCGEILFGQSVLRRLMLAEACRPLFLWIYRFLLNSSCCEARLVPHCGATRPGAVSVISYRLRNARSSPRQMSYSAISIQYASLL